MRGVLSTGMLLCASSKDGKDEGGIEFVFPPAGSAPGERIYFSGEKYESESALRDMHLINCSVWVFLTSHSSHMQIPIATDS